MHSVTGLIHRNFPFTAIVLGPSAMYVSSTTGFVGVGQLSAQSQLDVAGGVRASQGAPTNSKSNVGYSFSNAGDTGLVSSSV